MKPWTFVSVIFSDIIPSLAPLNHHHHHLCCSSQSWSETNLLPVQHLFSPLIDDQPCPGLGPSLLWLRNHPPLSQGSIPLHKVSSQFVFKINFFSLYHIFWTVLEIIILDLDSYMCTSHWLYVTCKLAISYHRHKILTPKSRRQNRMRDQHIIWNYPGITT